MTSRVLRIFIFILAGAVTFTGVTSTAAVDGLSVGNDLNAVDLRGDLTVRCDRASGGSDMAFYSCATTILDPAEYAYFVTTPGGSADEVQLVAIHEDGSKQKKQSDFDPVKGRSTDQINLWIWSLFQRPLLHAGRNVVTFKLLRNGKLERSGSFEVLVRTGDSRVCPRDFEWSSQEFDCRSGDHICRDYLARYNWCE